MMFGDQAGAHGEVEVAHQLFHVVRQRRFQLAQRGGTHADQLALEAAFTYHAGFFIAGYADARHAQLDHRRHQQADTVAISVCLEHGADFRLVGEAGLQGADVVFERGFADFNPGVAVLILTWATPSVIDNGGAAKAGFCSITMPMERASRVRVKGIGESP